MLRKDVAAACLAPLAIALRRFAKGPNIFFSPRNSHVFRLPQGEGINGSRRPMAARIAMTIAHADRIPGHGELDRPTETASIVAFWTGHIGFLIGFRTLGDGVTLTVQHSNLSRRGETNAHSSRKLFPIREQEAFEGLHRTSWLITEQQEKGEQSRRWRQRIGLQ
jgi:hypothetical protein